ncbi:MAG: hypothetical protein ABII27_09055 [bacterium]
MAKKKNFQISRKSIKKNNSSKKKTVYDRIRAITEEARNNIAYAVNT